MADGKQYYDALAGRVLPVKDTDTSKAKVPTSDANERQIGGSHYAGGYQHWDFVREMGLDYLQGCATKYVARWRKKNGVEDLYKALHYTEKRAENTMRNTNTPDYWDAPNSFAFRAIFLFGRENGLNLGEVEAIAYIVRGEWSEAHASIQRLIATAPPTAAESLRD